MSLKVIAPKEYEACRRAEEYQGGLSGLRGVLQEKGGEPWIQVDVGPDEVIPVSPTRIWQYLFERDEQISRTRRCRETLTIAAVTWAGAIIGSTVMHWLSTGAGGGQP